MLYREAEILIFDEPTAVLTPQEIEFLLNIIKGLKEAGKTIILITHDNSIAARASRIVRITDGRIVYDGPVDGDNLVSQQVAVGEDEEVSE